MNSSNLLLFLLVIFTVEAQASKGGLPLELKNYPREVRFSRHHPVPEDNSKGFTDLHTQSIWQEALNLFDPVKTYHRTVVGGHVCESLLYEQQAYAIKKMTKTEYLDPAEEKFYLKLGNGIDRRQVGFFETHRLIPAKAPILKLIENRNQVNEGARDYDQPDLVNVRSATVWNVAGQMLDPKTLEVEVLKLPWQLEEDWSAESKKFDRKKFPFVWEWGRAAQDLAGDIQPLYHANTLSNLMEIMAYHGPIDQGYVMFHSLAKSNTKIYEAAFPGTRYADKGNDENVLFLVPLRMVLAKYPPSALSRTVNDLKRLAPDLPEEYLVGLIRRFRDYTWLELDLVNSKEQTYLEPIVTLNWSSTFKAHTLKYLLHSMNIDEDRWPAIRRYLFNLPGTFANFNTGQYSDVTDHYSSFGLFNETDTLEISNVPKFMNKDPDALKRLLLEAFFFKLERVSEPYKLSLEDYDKIAEEFIAMGFQVAISTYDPVMSATLQKLGGVETKIPLVQLDRHPMPGEMPQGKTINTLLVVKFSLDQLQKMNRAEPTLLDETKYYLRELRHTLEYHLRQIDQF